MDELFPVGAGALLGVVLAGRAFWFQALCVAAAGLLATVLAGEGDPFWFYALLDCAQVTLGVVVAGAVCAILSARRGPGSPPGTG